LEKPWAVIRKAAGLDGLRLHDLRHSFASVGAGASLGLPIIGRLLGHSQAATTQRYAQGFHPVWSAAGTAGVASFIGPRLMRSVLVAFARAADAKSSMSIGS
jgi:hypothetical protein